MIMLPMTSLPLTAKTIIGGWVVYFSET